ncbi:MAG TPA: nodulation protein NfeD [candidate division Zixibacteria bacterium]|nr:nodulation protein NfeD [candidate division Zixibacteria bacterium]
MTESGGILRKGRVMGLRSYVCVCFLFCLVLVVALGGCLGLVMKGVAQGNSGPVVIVNFDVPVDPGSSGFVDSAVNNAIGRGASAIVIEMNTPGGLISDMQSILHSIAKANQSDIPTYTFVVPNGFAASAGSYIAMATNRIYMGPGSEIGPSTPIVVGGTDLEQNHTQAAMLSIMLALAEQWGRNSTDAFNMVQQDEAFTANEAVDDHLVDGLANSLSDLITRLGFSDRQQVTLNESLYNEFISALSNPTLDGILILLGIVAIVLDVYHPTIILTIAGAVGIVTGLIGAEVIGASSLGYLILAIAAVLIILELKLGHGFAMMIGVALGAFGIYYLAQGLNYSPSPITDVTELELFLIIVAGIVAGLYFRWIIGPIMHRGKLTGPEAIIGKTGKAVTDLRPDGEVRVGGIVWRAKSIQGDIQKGEPVRVKSLEDLVLKVEKTDGEPSTQTKK